MKTYERNYRIEPSNEFSIVYCDVKFQQDCDFLNKFFEKMYKYNEVN